MKGAVFAILLFLGLQGTSLALAPLYRYFNPSVVDHFYTTNFNELGGGGNGYNYEGIQSFIYPYPVKGSVPLYRYWQPQVSDHFYTTNPIAMELEQQIRLMDTRVRVLLATVCHIEYQELLHSTVTSMTSPTTSIPLTPMKLAALTHRDIGLRESLAMCLSIDF